jgi:putative transcriptional regulator
MPIITNLDVMMAKRKISLKELAERIGISNTNLSLLKTGKVQGVRYRTLEALCKELDCQPGDILEYQPDDEGDEEAGSKGAAG